nr:epidermis-specific secreted glycoprotein ep1 [Quercus suber]
MNNHFTLLITTNKGVVGFKLLPNGNMVLHSSKGNFVWQSFDSPTDTILVGQYLRAESVIKQLVSRASERDNKDGPYSLLMEPKVLSLYYKSRNSPSPTLYFVSPSDLVFVQEGTLENVTLHSTPETDEGYAYDLGLQYYVANPFNDGNRILARPKYNRTLSFLRLGINGNLRIYTYYDKVDWHAWEVTYTLFDRDSTESECQLPERCGEFGLCDNNQCVACPMSNGLLG